MSDESSPTLEFEMVIATSHPLSAYGGIQFGVEALGQLANELRSGQVPMLNNHDPLNPIRAKVLEAGVRATADGFHEVWARVEVEREGWEAYERGLSELGAPGGMSFSCSEHLATIDGSKEASAGTITLAADAACWTDETLMAGGADLSGLGTVDVQRRYSFAQDPTPFVVYGLPLLQGVMSSAIYDSAKHFLAPDRKSVFQFDFEGKGRRIRAVVKTSDSAVLHHAIDSFDRLLEREGTIEWKDEVGDWSQDPPPESD